MSRYSTAIKALGVPILLAESREQETLASGHKSEMMIYDCRLEWHRLPPGGCIIVAKTEHNGAVQAQISRTRLEPGSSVEAYVRYALRIFTKACRVARSVSGHRDPPSVLRAEIAKLIEETKA